LGRVRGTVRKSSSAGGRINNTGHPRVQQYVKERGSGSSLPRGGGQPSQHRARRQRSPAGVEGGVSGLEGSWGQGPSEAQGRGTQPGAGCLVGWLAAPSRVVPPTPCRGSLSRGVQERLRVTREPGAAAAAEGKQQEWVAALPPSQKGGAAQATLLPCLVLQGSRRVAAAAMPSRC